MIAWYASIRDDTPVGFLDFQGRGIAITQIFSVLTWSCVNKSRLSKTDIWNQFCSKTTTQPFKEPFRSGLGTLSSTPDSRIWDFENIPHTTYVICRIHNWKSRVLMVDPFNFPSFEPLLSPRDHRQLTPEKVST